MSEYKSPIEIIYEQVRYEMDNEIMRAVQSIGINVDKDELVKALAYDRDQYQKGFQDGKKFAEQELIRHGHWVGIDDFPHDEWECDHCGCVTELRTNFCPNCGADMRE